MHLVSPTQHGFPKKRSAFVALLEMQCKISDSIDNREFSFTNVLDQSKLFTANHKNIVLKRGHYGSKGVRNVWFSESLDNCSLHVSLKVDFPLINLLMLE